jgi:hypothetical protein
MAKMSRDAGQRAERQARDVLKALWPNVRRGLGQATGAREADLEECPLRIEVKAHRTWPSVEKALEQVRLDAERYDDTRPRAVVHRRVGKTEFRITFELSEFVRMMGAEYTVEQYIEDEIPRRE